mmetsp:Transcript_37394/g.112893  ORF Transcript_37394/g.112893 Transcript_37394/m.112893 type:complete len:202 (-) Transcript_37394:18-623(-)
MAQCPGAQMHLPDTHSVWPRELEQLSLEQLPPVSEAQAVGVAKQRPCCAHQPRRHLQPPWEQVVGPREAPQLMMRQVPDVSSSQLDACVPVAGAGRLAAWCFPGGTKSAARSSAAGASAPRPWAASCLPRRCRAFSAHCGPLAAAHSSSASRAQGAAAAPPAGSSVAPAGAASARARISSSRAMAAGAGGQRAAAWAWGWA